MSLLIKIKNQMLEQEDFNQVLETIKRNGLLVYPTETFYGLGGLATSEIVLENIYRLKGRHQNQPLPFVASDLAMVLNFIEEMPPEALNLTKTFWPGPLTLVLKARPGKLPKKALGPANTIAVRVPPLEWLQKLVRETGVLLVATSANLSGQPPLSSFDQVYELFGEKVDVLIDGGKTPGGQPSTILDVTVSPPRCLREGIISLERIQAELKKF
ncbi:MAG: threonylcarbamoyl-AMP synthase [Candidatus Aminicenantes bacterium]|nr:threonylcarbamoyl-AMP synthase [Candidatus Aminicenantes bacterium]